MKNLHMTSSPRDRERGSVAILIAVMWTALFGMAVVAVDFGYLYTKRRNVQAVGRRGGDRRHAGATRAAIRAARNTRALQVARNGYGCVRATTVDHRARRRHPAHSDAQANVSDVLRRDPRLRAARRSRRRRSANGGTAPVAAIHANDNAPAQRPSGWGVGVEVTGDGFSPSTAPSRARTRSTSEICQR